MANRRMMVTLPFTANLLVDTVNLGDPGRCTARSIPVEQIGTTDDCGFSPLCDDRSRVRDTAFDQIRAQVLGTEMASEILEGA